MRSIVFLSFVVFQTKDLKFYVFFQYLSSQIKKSYGSEELSMEKKIERISARLSNHPELWSRIDRLLDIVENQDGRATLADDAEEQVIVEIRKFGQEILGEWAKEGAKKQEEAVLNSGVSVKRKSKKKSIGIPPMEPSP